MKTLDQAMKYKFTAFDGRDKMRLSVFIPKERLKELGLELKDPNMERSHKEWTRNNILEQLEKDVAFGFEKALNRRGLSSDLMHSVILMWNWVLEEGLEGFNDYPLYGLPVLKATALKYGFENPIGDDMGSEDKYIE